MCDGAFPRAFVCTQARGRSHQASVGFGRSIWPSRGATASLTGRECRHHFNSPCMALTPQEVALCPRALLRCAQPSAGPARRRGAAVPALPLTAELPQRRYKSFVTVGASQGGPAPKPCRRPQSAVQLGLGAHTRALGACCRCQATARAPRAPAPRLALFLWYSPHVQHVVAPGRRGGRAAGGWVGGRSTAYGSRRAQRASVREGGAARPGF